MNKKPLNSGLKRRQFLQVGTIASLGISFHPFTSVAAVEKTALANPEKKISPEWRNKVSSMSYRQLGRTGLMISEMVSGGDPVRTDNYKHLELALEMGVNYLDMAPAYGRGECERGYGLLLKGSYKRDKVFLTTKVSGFSGVRNRMYRDIFNGLPSEKQEAYRKQARDLIVQRGVEQPGYFLSYWPNHKNAFENTYISDVMMKDYAHKVEGSGEFRKFIVNSLEESMKRVGVDHFDILMCPHGAASPEEVAIEEVFETMDLLKKQGKIRFLGVSTHNDPAGILRAAVKSDKYDMAMVSYNIVNAGFLEEAIRSAVQSGIGVIAMKAAMAVATHHQGLEIPEWRIAMVNRIVPGDAKPPVKAYLWALQNPNISAVISNFWDENYIRENLTVVGKKVDLVMG